MKITVPKTKEEFKEYYGLRWEILRKPWNRPKGSEKDDKEDSAHHIMAIENGKVIGVGRIHFNSEEEAQIRYMAVDPSFRGKNIGTQILKELERFAKENNAKRIVLNARKSAIGFYEKNNYKITEKAHTLFGSIEHYKMEKELKDY